MDSKRRACVGRSLRTLTRRENLSRPTPSFERSRNGVSLASMSDLTIGSCRRPIADQIARPKHAIALT